MYSQTFNNIRSYKRIKSSKILILMSWRIIWEPLPSLHASCRSRFKRVQEETMKCLVEQWEDLLIQWMKLQTKVTIQKVNIQEMAIEITNLLKQIDTVEIVRISTILAVIQLIQVHVRVQGIWWPVLRITCHHLNKQQLNSVIMWASNAIDQVMY